MPAWNAQRATGPGSAGWLRFGVSKPMTMNNHNAAAEPLSGTNPQNPGTDRAIYSSMEWFGIAESRQSISRREESGQ
jgi:hypothetical protein